MSETTRPLPGTVYDPFYPESDGEPLGENDFHIQAIIWLREALLSYSAKVPDVYVAADMFWYWEEGNPRACTAPDLMVIKGVGKHWRLSFRGWEEGGIRPGTIFDIASPRNWRRNLNQMRQLYESLAVPEYFLFDPHDRFLKPALQGFRLHKGSYVPLSPVADGSLTSRELGLRFTPEGPMLRVRNARTGRRVLTRAEQAERASRLARREAKRAEAAERRARELEGAEQRVQELEAKLARLRAQQASAKRGSGNGKSK